MISLLGNPNHLANSSSPDYAASAAPEAATVPVNSGVRWFRNIFSTDVLDEPTGNERAVASEVATSFEPWDAWPRFTGAYAVVARPGVDPNSVGGQATWDLYTPTSPRNEPVPWDAVGF